MENLTNKEVVTDEWRKIVIKTDGLKWTIDADESNTSVLELKELCREILKWYDVYKME